MAISVNPGTQVISIPQSDLTLISGTLYELDVDWLRHELRNWEDSAEGMPFPPTHNHSTAVTLSGVTYARIVEIVNGYTLDFEDTGTPYRVRCAGANHNLADVTIFNGHFSMIIGNSAGLITVTSGSGLSAEQDTKLDEVHKIHGLKSGAPLTVTSASRAVTGVSQTIEESGGTVTVTRN